MVQFRRGDLILLTITVHLQKHVATMIQVVTIIYVVVSIIAAMEIVVAEKLHLLVRRIAGRQIHLTISRIARVTEFIMELLLRWALLIKVIY